MNYIILDLEWDSTFFVKQKRFINQILQIGAVKLNENFDVIDTFEVVVKSAISKNSMIDIVFQTKGMNIKIKGTALKEGSIGDMILVRSEKYNKTYNGIVLSQSEVMVRI
jgi:flagella basal body P-ring formation protein FlgA